MKVTRIKGFTFSLLVLLASSLVASAQSVAGGNGDFSTPSSSSVPWGTSASGPQTVNWTSGAQYGYDPNNISGWTFTGGAGIQQNGSAWGFSNFGAGQTAFLQAYNGGIGVPKGAPTSISTTLGSLTKGDTFTLTFYMESRGGYGLNPIIVDIGGQAYKVTTPASSSTWTAYTITFTATGSSEGLSFNATFPMSGTYDNDTGIAGLSIAAGGAVGGTPISAPEGGAAGLYLLLGGTVCFGAMFLSPRKRFESLASA